MNATATRKSAIYNDLKSTQELGKLSQKVFKLRHELQVAEEEIANNTEQDSYEVYLNTTLGNAQTKLQRETQYLNETFERRQQKLMKELEELKENHERKVRHLEEAFEKTKNHCESSIKALHEKKYNSPKIRRIRAELKITEQEAEQKRTIYFGEAPVSQDQSLPPAVLEKNEGGDEEVKIPEVSVPVPPEQKKKRKAKVCMIYSTPEISSDDGFPPKCSMDVFATQLNNGNFNYIRAIQSMTNYQMKERYGFTRDEVFEHQCNMFGEE